MRLEIKNLSIGYKNTKILENINVSAQSGDFIALIGKNGSGKSTFLKTIAGILQEIQGDILIDGKSVFGLNLQDISQYFSIVLTDKITVPMQVYEFVSLGRHSYTNLIGSLTAQDKNIIDEVLNDLDLTELKHRLIQTLSDGEKQKVLIARALVQDTPIILLDEPTTHLDIENKAILLKKLQEISEAKKKIIILSTHDLNLILPKIKKIWLTKNTIIEKKPEIDISDFFDSKLLRYSKECQCFKLL